VKKINNLSELQDYIDGYYRPDGTVYATIDNGELNLRLTIAYWRNEEPLFDVDHGAFSDVSGNNFIYEEELKDIEICFDVDFPECVFEV
jgi:hypothetical protein